MFRPPGTAVPDGGQYLENLATAYWYSETLFAALELDIFAGLRRHSSLEGLAEAAACKPAELKRLLTALTALGLVQRTADGWRLEDLARRYLLPDSPAYLGDFLLYRRYLRPPWQQLAARISARKLPSQLSPQDDYPTRVRYYVRAMDALARRKADEIAAVLAHGGGRSPILDIGGGAGALSRRLLRGLPGGRAVLLEMAEVLSAARKLYPRQEQWTGISARPGDFRAIEFTERFGTIIMANMLHIYAPDETRQLLAKAAGLLLPGGLLLVHDYFPDRSGPVPAKGSLYDLNMMLNTCEGRCHNSSDIAAWLKEAGLGAIEINDLDSDSAIICARSSKERERKRSMNTTLHTFQRN